MGARLGQHYLVSERVAARIVHAAKLSNEDTVLEIGPGKGILTKHLLAAARRVIAVEKEGKLAATLAKRFNKEIEDGRLHLISSDVRSFAISDFQFPISNYKVVANIPYYITGELLRMFLTAPVQPRAMTLLVQREVAERIVAADGKGSILSVSVAAFGEPSVEFIVSRDHFAPQPKVDSAVLTIQNISRDRLGRVDEKKFFDIVKRGFAKKRKLLLNNLALSSETLEYCGVPKKSRAENLTLANWICLAKHRGR